VAKARRSRPAPKARKGGTRKSKRAKPVRKASVKASKKSPKALKKVELKQLRAQFGQVLAVLSARRSSSPDVNARLDDARRRISQWMTDIDDICTPEDQEICGPDMAFPIP
jgi:hypothetical protein